MSERSKDELIEAQKEVIGILFEIIKRLQANNELDEEYFQLLSNVQERDINQKRLDEILKEREENGKIVTRLLEKLEI
ncbi:MAG: hydrolase [Nitrosopumilaceae archaeon]